MSEGQRIDKWLWHARFAKTRTAAQQLAKSGHVRVDRVRNTSASRVLKVGETLTIAQGMTVRIVRVKGFGLRRGPAVEARLLYDELEVISTPTQKDEMAAPGAGARPSARDRRLLQELKRRGAPQ